MPMVFDIPAADAYYKTKQQPVSYGHWDYSPGNVRKSEYDLASNQADAGAKNPAKRQYQILFIAEPLHLLPDSITPNLLGH